MELQKRNSRNSCSFLSSDIEDKILNCGLLLSETKYSSNNINISLLKGDNVALLYSSDLTLYKVLGTFNFSMAIFVRIFALVSCYKHKMIGLELILPFQVILYSQFFSNLVKCFKQRSTLLSSLFGAYFYLSLDQNNAWYREELQEGSWKTITFCGWCFWYQKFRLLFACSNLQHCRSKQVQTQKVDERFGP